MTSVHDIVVGRLAEFFSKPVLQNSLRSMYVEEQVGVLLGDRWRSVGGDWAGWDFEDVDGVRLEVKQSAATQSWAQATPSPGSFDIKARQGRYDGATWVPEVGRAADIYVLAWHGGWGHTADQRDETQWEYYVISADRLPPQKTIALSVVRKLGPSVAADELVSAADALAAEPRKPRVARAVDREGPLAPA